MQIGASAAVSLPALGLAPGAAVAALAIARSALFRDAVLIAAAARTAPVARVPSAPAPAFGFDGQTSALPAATTPTSILELLRALATPQVSVAGGSPILAPPQPGSALSASGGSSVPGLRADDTRLQPLPSITGITAGNTAAGSPLGRERLTVSPALAALQPDLTALTQTPAGRLLLEIIEALTGEPQSQWQLLSAGSPAAADASGIAGLSTKAPGEALQLLVQGKVRSEDGHDVDLSLGLSVQKQPGTVFVDRALLTALQSAIEQLAQTKIELSYPGAAADLAGHRLPFQTLLDPHGLWPLQSFFVSGLLVFGRARLADDDEEDADEDEYESDDESLPSVTHAEASKDAAGLPPRKPKPRKAKRAQFDELTPLPADGGVPIITSRRWLELELRHLRSQMRMWMSLPPMTASLNR